MSPAIATLLAAINLASATFNIAQAVRFRRTMRAVREQPIAANTMTAGELFEAARASADANDFIRRVVMQFGPWGRRA